ncbi:MAG: DNA primase, partial [Wolbachia sp.]
GEYLSSKSPELIEAEQNLSIILRIVIELPEILHHPIFFEQFSHFEFTNAKMKKLQQHIIDAANNGRELNREALLQEFEQSSCAETVKFIFEKTSVLNSQLNERRSAEIMWNNLMLRKELNVLQEEKIKARLGGNFDLEERLIEQIRKIEDSIQEMQMEFIQK